MEPWRNNTGQTIDIPSSTVKRDYVMFDEVTPEYLKTFGVRMRAGRWFEASDNLKWTLSNDAVASDEAPLGKSETPPAAATGAAAQR